ncbi:MAG: type II toxin-antitoxin system ParD family antitoxin [Planctomycetia bacterium]|nr:type II toxin-antitoxin system ParD family antitoxin [Planctomycetia bacterium]
MDTLNISLPKVLKRYVQQRVRHGGYGNTSEYVRELIRTEQKQRAHAELEAMLLEGIQSGPATEMTKANWNKLRERLKSKAKQQKRK